MQGLFIFCVESCLTVIIHICVIALYNPNVSLNKTFPFHSTRELEAEGRKSRENIRTDGYARAPSVPGGVSAFKEYDNEEDRDEPRRIPAHGFDQDGQPLVKVVNVGSGMRALDVDTLFNEIKDQAAHMAKKALNLGSLADRMTQTLEDWDYSDNEAYSD